MFTADMIAPCGLDCSICYQAQLKENPCPGCNTPGPDKPDFCSKYCGIILCKKRKNEHYRFCDECMDYPCEDVMEKEKRYTSKYPLKESPLANLKMICEKGMEFFIKEEKKKFSCPACGCPVSVHTGICSGCQKKIETL